MLGRREGPHPPTRNERTLFPITAPIRQWCDALAATTSHMHAIRSPFFTPGVPIPPTRLLIDRLLGTLLALHRALPRCLPALPPSQGQRRLHHDDWRREEDSTRTPAALSPPPSVPPAPYLQELARILTTLVAAVPYPALNEARNVATASLAPPPRRRRALLLAPGAVSVWEAARQEMAASLKLALVRVYGCLLAGQAPVVDAGPYVR